jgi:hypothetical protein
MIVKRLLLVLLVAFSLASLAAGSVAQAQNPSTPGTTPDTASTSATASEEDDDEEAVLAVAILVVGSILALAFLFYIGWVQALYYKVARALAERGKPSVPSPVRSIITAELLAEGETVPVQIKGPDTATVGEKAVFQALRAGEPVDVTWMLVEGEATLDPASGTAASSVTVTPTKAGAFALKAKSGDIETSPLKVTVVDAPEEKSKTTLPFVGDGYGTVLIAIVLLTFASVLALMDKLSTDAVATLFGAVAGYLFAVRPSASGSSSGTSSRSASGSSGDEGTTTL